MPTNFAPLLNLQIDNDLCAGEMLIFIMTRRGRNWIYWINLHNGTKARNIFNSFFMWLSIFERKFINWSCTDKKCILRKLSNNQIWTIVSMKFFMIDERFLPISCSIDVFHASWISAVAASNVHQRSCWLFNLAESLSLTVKLDASEVG